jgi:hypothetical protein
MRATVPVTEKVAAHVRHGLCAIWMLCTVFVSTSPALAGSAQDRADSQTISRLRHVRCSLLVGSRVSSAPSSDGKRADLGTAHDFLLDGDTGRVTHVIVKSGGVAGIGDTLRCFDIAALDIDPTHEPRPALALAITASAFSAAPSIGARDLDPFRAEIIATQGHCQSSPPEQFVPRAPILLLSELIDLEVTGAQDSQPLVEVEDGWLELGDKTVGYLSLVGREREVPVPYENCSFIAVPRMRALQLRIALGDARLDAAPALSTRDSGELDEGPFRQKVAAHFSGRVTRPVQERSRT